MIYIDASRYSNTAKRTGVENYSYYLINELAKAHPKEITLISPRKIDLDVAQIVIPFPRLWTHLRLSWEIFKTKKLNNIFVPSHVLPLIHPKKSVITIHDVAFKDSPKSYSLASRIYLNWAAKFAVKHAKKIIVPSQKTYDDLIRHYKCPKKKLHVVPLGYATKDHKISAAQRDKVLEKFNLKSKCFYFYIGRLEHKKNTDNLIKAFVELTKNTPNLKLVMAGATGHGGEEILKLIPDNLKNRILYPGYIGETEKNVLMRETLAFVFPSREEGFGIPLLEAMDAGVPIIASNIPTSKEIAGKNAHFFEVEDDEKLSHLMYKMSIEKDPEGLKTNKHKDTLKKYSWKETAETIYKLLTD